MNDADEARLYADENDGPDEDDVLADNEMLATENARLNAEIERRDVEIARLRKVEKAAQAFVMAGLCGNPDQRAELRELIRVARTDGPR